MDKVVSIDLGFMPCGDYPIMNGDFADTSDQSPILYEIQETVARLRASEADFLMDSDELAANLDKAVGSEMSDLNIRKVERRIKHALSFYPYLSAKSSLSIRAMKMSPSELGVYLQISNKDYGDYYISVYMNFSTSSFAVEVEGNLDVY